MSAAVEILEPEAEVRAAMRAIGAEARQAARRLANTPTEQKNRALIAAARAVRERSPDILAANARDLADARAKSMSAALLDRLTLNPARIEAMARGLEEVAALPDPVGRVLAAFTRPNGLVIERTATPLGVVGVIYESRPNVTADAGALCLKSGNAVVLRGGSDSFHSSAAIHACLVAGLKAAGLPEAAISRAPFASRAAVGEMLEGLGGALDVIVPRGGRSLVERVQREARAPVFAHLEGIVHVYIDRAADPDKALKVVVNAKMRRTGVCGAAETLLVHRDAASFLLKPLIAALIEAGCAVRGDAAACAADPRATPASEEDWRTEYLDAIIAVRVVDSLEAAIDHIETYGSHHTDCIVTEDRAAAERFLEEVELGDRPAQRLDPVRRRRRVRFRGRDRHRHRPHARARADRPRAALHLQVPGARRRADPPLTPRRGRQVEFPAWRENYSEFEILPPPATIAAIIIGVMSAAWGEFPIAPIRE